MNKIIRDSLHGYISLPSIIFSEIIDTPIFQRLKRIEQTSMRPLYPSAHHDRFVHSIGVYYLGEKAFNGLIKNIEKDDYYIGKEQIWEQYGLLFKIACLLHDCGHSPFSHSFEYAYLGDKNGKKLKEIKCILKESLINLADSDFADLSDESKLLYESSVEDLFSGSPSPHEVFSSLVVVRHFRSNIKHVCETLLEGFKITIDDIEFIQRAILGMKYDIEKVSDGESKIKFNILNCLIQLLNSKSFDVDKLDYIMRDSAASGVKNLAVDVERLLNALTIIEIHEYRSKIEIKSDINNSVIIKDLKTHINGDLSEKCELNLSLSNVRLDGTLKGHLTINNGSITIDKKFNINGNGEFPFESETSINGFLEDAIIKGHFVGSIEATHPSNNVDGFIRCHIDGSICGTVIGNVLWENKGITLYEIGYKQSALSVIEDTIIARNRLYMWTYAHHKVTYIDYLLRNAVLVSLLDKSNRVLNLSNIENSANERLEKLLSLDIFEKNTESYLLDDSRFVTMMTDDMVNSQNMFAEKYLSRTKSFSVWKTYAEYNMYFCDLSIEERRRLFRLLFDREEKQEGYSEGNLQFFPNSILKDYPNSVEYTWIHPSGYKLSKISADDTYLLFNKSVRRLKDIMIKDKSAEEYVDHKSFFYLYTSSHFDYDQKMKLIDFLKNKLRETINSSST